MAAIQHLRELIRIVQPIQCKFVGISSAAWSARSTSAHNLRRWSEIESPTINKTAWSITKALHGSRHSSLLPARSPQSSAVLLKFYTSSPHATSAVGRSSPKQEKEHSPYSNPFDADIVDDLLNHMEGDLPLPEMPDPFAKNYHRCYLCRHNIHLDHKNIRLLSQFVSPYTGRIYGRAITGLCIPMQRHVSLLIKRARISGFMPVILKDSKYLNDPQPFEPMSKRT